MNWLVGSVLAGALLFAPLASADSRLEDLERLFNAQFKLCEIQRDRHCPLGFALLEQMTAALEKRHKPKPQCHDDDDFWGLGDANATQYMDALYIDRSSQIAD